MLERLVAAWPQERFAPTMVISVSAPPSSPAPDACAKRRALDCVDAWLDRVLRLPMVVSWSRDAVFDLDLSCLFRRTHAFVEGGVETTLRFQETFLPDGVLAYVEPRVARAFDSLWTPRVLVFLACFGGKPAALRLRERLAAHHHASSVRSVLNRLAVLANDELRQRIGEGWVEASSLALAEMTAPSGRC